MLYSINIYPLSKSGCLIYYALIECENHICPLFTTGGYDCFTASPRRDYRYDCDPC